MTLRPLDIRWFAESDWNEVPKSLVASQCRQCKEPTFPRSQYCSLCGSADMRALTLSDYGRVAVATLVHRAPPGFQAPYQVAYVDLPEGIQLFGILKPTHPVAAPGTKVRVDIHSIRSDSAQTNIIGYGFARVDDA